MGLELGEFDQRRGGREKPKTGLKTGLKTGPLDRLHRGAAVCMVVCAVSTTTSAATSTTTNA
jgi:hypothetical protein